MARVASLCLPALLMGATLALSACERPPRPDPGRWEKVPAKDVPKGVEDPVTMTQVKFDVGFAEAPPRATPRKRPVLAPLPAQVKHGRCDESAGAQEAESTQLKAVPAKGGTLTVTLTGYRYSCSPKPDFAAGMDADHGIVIAEVAPPRDTPIARCTCLHDVTVVVTQVPSGEHELRVFSRLGGDGDPVPVAMTTFEMRE